MSAVHKRGDTFDRSGKITITQNGVMVTDLTGWTGACQLRIVRGTELVDLKFEWVDASRCLARIYAPNGTDFWGINSYRIDIRLKSPSGLIVSTAATMIDVVRGATVG